MMVHSCNSTSNFGSLCPTNGDALLKHNSNAEIAVICRYSSAFSDTCEQEESTLDDSAVFSDDFHLKFVCGESSEETPGAAQGGGGGGGGDRGKELEAEEEAGSGSTSPSEEAPQRREEQEEEERRRREQEQEQQTTGGGGGRRRSESRHPVYRGVRKRQGDRWVSEIREPGKKSRIWLGTFPTPEMAARAYDVAAFNLKRPYAYLNFPESASLLPSPLSCSRKDIQAAAAAAAAAFHGVTSTGGGGAHVPTARVAETSASASTSTSSASMPMIITVLETEAQAKAEADAEGAIVAVAEAAPVESSSPRAALSFVDEDIIFDMPNVLTDMAEGLMITPPLLHHGTIGDNNNNSDHNGGERSIWDP